VAENIHPLAAHDLPSFIVQPGEADNLMIFVAIFLIVTIVSVGILYFNLHSLPERMSHRTSKVQFEIVAVLGLLALFTHNHAFWIAALLLAFVRIPDFETPLYTISDSLQKLVGETPTPRAAPQADAHGTTTDHPAAEPPPAAATPPAREA
jgi:hypothetical protein